MATKKATPWGKAVLVEEVVVALQAPGPKKFSTHAQLLETESGERLVRLAYSTGDDASVRRGPVTMHVDDLERLIAEVGGHPELAAAFGLNGGRTRLRRSSARAPRRPASPG